MAKTAINIDRDLADKAAAILGTETLTATVETALREIVERDARQRALAWFRENPFSEEERRLAAQAWT